MNNIKELSFSEYYLSKKKLLETAEECPRIYSHYTMTKYKRVPVVENYDSEKIYISLKPDDNIEILWEYENIYFPTARSFVILDSDGTRKTYYPCWSNKKLLSWVMNNAVEVNHATGD